MSALHPEADIRMVECRTTANDPKQPFKICRNRETKLKKLVPFIALIWVATSGASGPVPTWSFWQAHVENRYCELRNEFDIPFRNDPSRYDPGKKGFLTGTAFDRAFIRFVADAQLHGEDSLGVIRFHLYVYPEVLPNAPATSERIIEASLGGFHSEAKEVSNIHTFSLNEDESTQLLQRFINNEIVEFELKFANGDMKQFKIYPSGNRTFYVLADMFHTCIKSHKGKKR